MPLRDSETNGLPRGQCRSEIPETNWAFFARVRAAPNMPLAEKNDTRAAP
jgi:hypothetical protein